MASNNFTHAARRSMAMGPSVRNLLHHYQIDPSKISPTGPHQILLKGDVISYININQLSPAHPGTSRGETNQTAQKPKVYTPNLDISGYQPKTGPEGFSEIAKRLLGK